MTPKGLLLFVGGAFLALAEPGWAQKSPHWRVFKLADNLAEPACTAVTVAPNGKILAKHLNVPSISELDGYNVNLMPSPTGKNRIYESPGGQLWTVCAEGLQEFKNGDWLVHSIPEIAAEFRTGLPRLIDPIPLCPVRQGLVIGLVSDRLLEFNFEDSERPRTRILRTASQTSLQRFSGLTLNREREVWVAGARGLAKAAGPLRNLKPETEWHEYISPESLHIQNLQCPSMDEEGGITMVAESSQSHQKIIAHFDLQRWTIEYAGTEKIRYAWRGPDKTRWAMTSNSLFQWDEDSPEMTENEEVAARQYYDVAVEPSGIFWLATSDGLFRYAPLTWRAPRSSLPAW